MRDDGTEFHEDSRTVDGIDCILKDEEGVCLQGNCVKVNPRWVQYSKLWTQCLNFFFSNIIYYKSDKMLG